MTDAPSMPMKTHIMIRMQLVTWVGTSPRSTPVVAMTVALRLRVPQKSSVKTPAWKLNAANAMKIRMEAIFTNMTNALRPEALSTPRMTR